MAQRSKEYLGDAVFVEFDGFHAVLTTSDGLRTTNTIALDPVVIGRFEDWLDRLKKNMESALSAGEAKP